jgi:hypothetical protein
MIGSPGEPGFPQFHFKDVARPLLRALAEQPLRRQPGAEFVAANAGYDLGHRLSRAAGSGRQAPDPRQFIVVVGPADAKHILIPANHNRNGTL